MSLKSKYFTDSEMQCKHCGKSKWDAKFMNWLDTVRFEFGKPLIITSGYRCPEHPVEAKKPSPGVHSTGKAVDIAIQGEDAIRLTHIAYKLGCRRVGWNQKGSARFVHLDRADKPNGSWSY